MFEKVLYKLQKTKTIILKQLWLGYDKIFIYRSYYVDTPIHLGFFFSFI